MEVKTGIEGVSLWPGYFDEIAQRELMRAIETVVAQAPLFVPVMPRTGRPFSVRMTNCGVLGWVSDRSGYRYQPHHPDTAQAWPAIPPVLLELWQAVGAPASPEACLINFYGPGAKMGLHQDSDEIDRTAPVVSVSLGASAVFRVGGTERRAPTRSFKLHSGDVVVFGGPARLIYHGVDRILPGSSQLVEDGGRINMTLRRVNAIEPLSETHNAGADDMMRR
ncbi:MAG: alpha-ketoglutarate-dependent dioxygenase AlkB [Pseudomonadota bacterium]